MTFKTQKNYNNMKFSDGQLYTAATHHLFNLCSAKLYLLYLILLKTFIYHFRRVWWGFLWLAWWSWNSNSRQGPGHAYTTTKVGMEFYQNTLQWSSIRYQYCCFFVIIYSLSVCYEYQRTLYYCLLFFVFFFHFFLFVTSTVGNNVFFKQNDIIKQANYHWMGTYQFCVNFTIIFYIISICLPCLIIFSFFKRIKIVYSNILSTLNCSLLPCLGWKWLIAFSTSLVQGQTTDPCRQTWGSILSACLLQSNHPDIPKIDNGQFQNWMVDKSIFKIQQVKSLNKIQKVYCSTKMTAPC